jgi:hypothetical protein
MQDTTLATSWKRISDKLKGLINSRGVERVQDTLPPNAKEKDDPQLASWEGEGGKGAGRPPM